MTQFNFKKLSLSLTIFTLIVTAFTINSCRKDNAPPQSTITDPAISQAKTWYDIRYSVNTNNSNALSTAAKNSSINRSLLTRNSVNQQFDFSQHIKPDWKNATTYTRLKKGVVEIPIDPAFNFGSEVRNLSNSHGLNKKYNRTSFLILNDGKKYAAYIMMILADSTYIGSDFKKLSHNTYRHHDADFTGMVLYFTPKGQYVNGFTYRNGQLVLSTAIKSKVGSTSQNVKTRATLLKREDLNCTDWYADYYVDNVLVASQYLGTTCDGTIPAGSGGGTDDASLSPAGTDIIDQGFPVPGDPSVFGLNNSNTVVPDANFDNLLNYVQVNSGLNITDPIGPGITYNGVFYPGQVTYIYDSSGNTVASYFSPDENSDLFQLGMEYNLGDLPTGSNTFDSSNDIVLGGIDFGSPAGYLGGGSTTTNPSVVGGGAGTPPNSIFSNVNNPTDASDDPVINLGIGVTNISADPPLQGTLIAHTTDRRPPPPAIAEDMTYGTNGDVSGIASSEINLSDNVLFGNMTSLFHACTFFDPSGLGAVGDKMIQQFKTKSGGQFSDPVLNQRVSASSTFQNFIQRAGNDINTALKNANGNINQVNLQLNYRPTFNGLYNKFHGLQILINDTEYTTIQISNFNILNGNWSATLDITIYDDFGLDKNDAETYQGYHSGFADWWLLQHTRGYVPFTTIVHLRVIITASF